MTKLTTILAALCLLAACSQQAKDPLADLPSDVPAEYLEEREDIPSFWVATTAEVEQFIKTKVQKGKWELLGKSAGGRPIYGVTYGTPRQGRGTSTYSGASSVKKIGAYRGADNDKKVYMTMAGVHGFELEGIVGSINLINVLETGKDLAGNEWPEIVSMLDSLDRIVIIPLCNPDGRDRLPIRMEKFRGHEPDAFHVHEYLNTGGRDGGKLIGWPDCKEWVPIPFDKFEFPGTYPNDNGYNLMHDNFFGQVQPENRIILDVAEREMPDVIMNMHTGVSRDNYFIEMLSPTVAAYPPVLLKAWQELYTYVHTEFALNGLKKTMDPVKETTRRPVTGAGSMNLTSVLAFHCGALSTTVEDGSHGYTGIYDDGTPVEHTPEKILKAELTAHRAAMQFLSRNGGVPVWEQKYK